MQREVELAAGPREWCGVLRNGRPATLLLDGADATHAGWRTAGLVALDARRLAAAADQTEVPDALARLERRLTQRRRRGGTAHTGVALLLAYDALDPGALTTAKDEALPVLLALEVDRSLIALGPGRALWTGSDVDDPAAAESDVAPLRSHLRGATASAPPVPAGPPRTSLPHESYLRGVEAVQRFIAAGDVYQANLCQRFDVPFRGDAFEYYRRLSRGMEAPHSAFLEVPGLALASVSPESFVAADPERRIETLPIKGTRPRGATPEADEAAARELLESAKDRAELLMIVDLERNDLGRVCETGSVAVPELATLRSFATVHHLVARIEGRLREGTGLRDLLRAIFPGGSITGAPKRRAIEILRGLEPVRRNFFTGSLFWFADDGSIDSSILIRTAVLAEGRAWIGAGGGIVADSDPVAEWRESNHKARALTRALGFEPEEAR